MRSECGGRGLMTVQKSICCVACFCLCSAAVFFRWLCPRTPWCFVQQQWAGQNMVVAAFSSSWAGWAYCPAYKDSSQAADELWSPDTKFFSSQSSPSWLHLHRATASERGKTPNINMFAGCSSMITFFVCHSVIKFLWHITEVSAVFSGRLVFHHFMSLWCFLWFLSSS